MYDFKYSYLILFVFKQSYFTHRWDCNKCRNMNGVIKWRTKQKIKNKENKYLMRKKLLWLFVTKNYLHVCISFLHSLVHPYLFCNCSISPSLNLWFQSCVLPSLFSICSLNSLYQWSKLSVLWSLLPLPVGDWLFFIPYLCHLFCICILLHLPPTSSSYKLTLPTDSLAYMQRRTFPLPGPWLPERLDTHWQKTGLQETLKGVIIKND